MLVQAPCRFMAFFYSKKAEQLGYMTQVYRGVYAGLVPPAFVGALVGFVVALAARASLSGGAAYGAMIGLALAVIFMTYAHVLVYTLAFKGRDWREM